MTLIGHRAKFIHGVPASATATDSAIALPHPRRYQQSDSAVCSTKAW